MTTPEPYPELEASDLGRFEPTPYDLGISEDPEVTWAEVREPYGPQLPGLQDLYLAQDAAYEADRAGRTDAVYDRLVLERQQTEAAYLDGYDRDLVRDLEAESADPEAGLGHDYDGPELRSGTPEYDALYAEYQAWAEAGPEPEAEWDSADSNAYQARAEAGPEPEAEL